MICVCCSRIFDGPNGARRAPRAAVYVWHDPRGYEWPLCIDCTAIWRDEAGEFQPERITQIRRLAAPV